MNYSPKNRNTIYIIHIINFIIFGGELNTNINVLSCLLYFVFHSTDSRLLWQLTSYGVAML